LLEVAGLLLLVPEEALADALGKDPPEREVSGGELRVSVELYDLRDDPEERQNCADAEPQRTRTLTAELDGWQRRTAAASLSGRGRQTVDAETRRRLRALGYVQ